MAIHSSILAWEILWTEQPAGYSPLGHKRVRYDLATKPPPHTHTHTYRQIDRYRCVHIHTHTPNIRIKQQSSTGLQVIYQRKLGQSQTVKVYYMHAKSLQSHPTLCNPTDCSLPGSSVREILQARILELVAMPSSRRSSQPREQTPVSYISFS